MIIVTLLYLLFFYFVYNKALVFVVKLYVFIVFEKLCEGIFNCWKMCEIYEATQRKKI